jgi:hypothetical protein
MLTYSNPLDWLLLAGGLLLASAVQAQTPARKVPTAVEVKRAVEHLGSLRRGDGWAEDVARKVVAYLKAHRPDEDEASEIGLTLDTASDDQAQLSVYSFAHESGGTRGTVHNVVVQWQNAAGQLFAYHLPVECGFSEVYPLKAPGRNMYLLLGREKAYTFCIAFTAYVVELKGDYLILDNKVFSINGHGDKNELSDCNVAMTFDPARQVLSVDIDEGLPQSEEEDGFSTGSFKPFNLLFRQGRFVPLP